MPKDGVAKDRFFDLNHTYMGFIGIPNDERIVWIFRHGGRERRRKLIARLKDRWSKHERQRLRQFSDREDVSSAFDTAIDSLRYLILREDFRLEQLGERSLEETFLKFFDRNLDERTRLFHLRSGDPASAASAKEAIGKLLIELFQEPTFRMRQLTGEEQERFEKVFHTTLNEFWKLIQNPQFRLKKSLPALFITIFKRRAIDLLRKGANDPAGITKVPKEGEEQTRSHIQVVSLDENNPQAGLTTDAEEDIDAANGLTPPLDLVVFAMEIERALNAPDTGILDTLEERSRMTLADGNGSLSGQQWRIYQELKKMRESRSKGERSCVLVLLYKWMHGSSQKVYKLLYPKEAKENPNPELGAKRINQKYSVCIKKLKDRLGFPKD